MPVDERREVTVILLFDSGKGSQREDMKWSSSRLDYYFFGD